MAAQGTIVPSRNRRLLVWVLAGLTIIVGLVFGLRWTRRQAQLIQRQNNLKQIWIAVYNFHLTYNRLPPAVRKDKAGRPLSSWRFQLVPFLEAMMREMDFGVEWNSPVNQWLAEIPLLDYCWLPRENFPECLTTNVFAVTGPGTAFEDDKPIRLQDLDPGTILLCEVAHSGVHWMAPGDLSVEAIPPSLTQGLEGDGFHVVFADGEIWFLLSEVPLEELKKFFTIEGAKKNDREAVLGPFVRSRHPRK